jgi:acetyl esterase/lipase
MKVFPIALLLSWVFAIFSSPSLAASTKRDVDIVAPDGVKLRATYYAGADRGSAVLLFHQCSRTRGIWEPLATKLAREGLRVLTVEPRGIGESQGEQWDYDGNLDHALQYWRKNWSADAEAAYQWLVSQPGVDKNDVGVVGGGCGAFLALLTAQRHYPEVRTIVLLSDFDDDATRTFVKDSPGLAILSAVSEQDPMSLAAAKEIHALSKNPASRLLPFAEQGHGFGLIEKHAELEATIIDWLKVHAMAQEPSQPPPPIEQLYRMPAVYSVPGMEKVEIHRDIVYSKVKTAVGDVELKMDVYMPPGAKPGQKFPAVMLISGGGIEGGKYDWRDAGVYQSYGKILAASGMIGVAYSKRYARGIEGTRNGIADTDAALSYLMQHSTEFHIDPTRRAFWAFSAGGLVLSMTLRQMVPSKSAVLCFYCVTDIDMEGVAAADADRIRLYVSPLFNVQHHDDTFTPPIFVARAGLDSPSLNNNLDQFVAAALKENLFIEVVNHPNGRHGFDVLDDNDRSREIILRALEFLKVRLSEK